MKKIPTLFKRVFTPDHKKTITREVTPGCECVLQGECIPTVKWDGACCAIIDGEIYKRYDAKIDRDGKQKSPPKGAIPCQPEPDPITGHWPHWVRCVKENPEDKYFLEAAENFFRIPWLSREPAQPYKLGYIPFRRPETLAERAMFDGTYEAIGPCIQSNPYGCTEHTLRRHGDDIIHDLWFRVDGKPDEYAFDKIRGYLEKYPFEGIVFWKDGVGPVCKIKRTDFGFTWPPKERRMRNG